MIRTETRLRVVCEGDGCTATYPPRGWARGTRLTVWRAARGAGWSTDQHRRTHRCPDCSPLAARVVCSRPGCGATFPAEGSPLVERGGMWRAARGAGWEYDEYRLPCCPHCGPTLALVKLVESLAGQGMYDPQIARRVGRSSGWVWLFRKQHGIQGQPRGRRRGYRRGEVSSW